MGGALTRVTLVPIETFTHANREKIESLLRSRVKLHEVDDGYLGGVFQELTDDLPRIYKGSDDSNFSYLAFHGTSFCVVLLNSINNFSVNYDNIKNELLIRRELHKKLIEQFSEYIDGFVWGSFIESFQIKPNYAFSFYILERSAFNPSSEENLIFLLEPSLVDIDDMLSSASSPPIERRRGCLNDFEDCDINPNCSVFLTWASGLVVWSGGAENFTRVLYLLMALEVRLQIVWNKCHSLSNYIDSVFSGRTINNEFDRVYWGSVRALDDSRGVLSSTSSTRANNIFDKMIASSRLEGELRRLEGKIEICEKFIKQKSSEVDNRYKKAIELLLFGTAISQIMPILFSLPLEFAKGRELASSGIISAIIVVGAFVILKRRE